MRVCSAKVFVWTEEVVIQKEVEVEEVEEIVVPKNIKATSDKTMQ